MPHSVATPSTRTWRRAAGAFDWDTVERATIEPSTEDAKATHLRNSLLGVTLSRDLEKDPDA